MAGRLIMTNMYERKHHRNVVKDRKCKACQKKLRMTAKEIREHEELCSRYYAAGLVMPGGVEEV